MLKEQRPDPDALLASLRGEETGPRRGRLKIFFGMCPGVGKTCAMLEAARQQLAKGVEVVAGIVETHGRTETARLLEGIPIVPRAQVSYRGITLEEMDLDALLVWHPKLVLVDELAHTNVPGSRHLKRFQDVLELLDAGIDVYTTLNVQHIESRKDTVRQITGIEVRESVPDSMLDLASEITLIDLSPDQLRTRLSEGKVYLQNRAATAADHFFRESNLVALREMSLRLTAEHVDRDLRQIKGTTGEPWKAGDRLMVAISGSPTSEKLIRWARRAAASMEASWIGVHVETPEPPSSDFNEVRLGLNLALARQLGAEVVMVEGADIAATLLRVARQHNVSQIILGKPGRRTFGGLFRRSPVDWMVRHSGEIDIQLVKGEGEPSGRLSAASLSSSSLSSSAKTAKPPLWRDYASSLAVAAGVTLFGMIMEHATGYWAIALVYLLAVIVCSLRLRRWPTLFLAALSAILWDLWFIPPRFTLNIREVHDFMMFGMYFAVALIVSHLTSRLREREEAERLGEARATALYRLSRALAASREVAETVAIAVRQIRETFGAESALLVRDETGCFSGEAHPASSFHPTAKEESVAGWVFQHRRAAGQLTDTLPDSEAYHLPLITGGGIEGVLAIAFISATLLSTRRRELLEAFAAQVAVTLEKDRLASISRKAQVAAQSEKLQRTLFDTVSHELKTPLAAIIAGLERADETDGAVPVETKQAAARLTQVVNHLLDMTRLESGLLKPHLEWVDPSELVSEALERVRAQTQLHRLTVKIEPELSPIRVDPGLIEQVLAILISNAALYSPPESEIHISAALHGALLRLAVADRGPGLKPGDEEKVFQRFYRGDESRPGGIGLGLSIAQRLVETHQGSLTATNRSGGGALFLIELPAVEPLQLPEESLNLS